MDVYHTWVSQHKLDDGNCYWITLKSFYKFFYALEFGEGSIIPKSTIDFNL